MAKGKNPKHTACRKGTTVIIKPIKGEPIIDVFVERKGGNIYLERFGVIRKKDMRSFAVYKNR